MDGSGTFFELLVGLLAASFLIFLGVAALAVMVALIVVGAIVMAVAQIVYWISAGLRRLRG
jgi:hypothetical protein